MLLNYGHWCGIAVSTSTDLKNWSAPQLLFGNSDGTGPGAAECTPNAAPLDTGCYGFGLIWNASTNKWIGWLHAGMATPVSVVVVTCDPDSYGGPKAGSCTQQPNPAGPTAGGRIGSTKVFKDPATGNGYLCFNSPSGVGSTFYIQQLNASYTNVVGAATTVGKGIGGADAEIPNCWARAGTYYFAGGGNCPYCGGTDTSYRTATSPLGPWGASLTQISSDSCGGQPAAVDSLIIGGNQVDLYRSDQWAPASSNNQAQTNQYFEVLTYTGSTVNQLTCNTTTTITGLTETPLTPPVADQGDWSGQFGNWCDIAAASGTAHNFRMQTFVPSKPYLATIYITTGQNTSYSAGECSYASSTCQQIDGNLIIDFVSIDASNNPAATLKSTTFTPGQVKSSLMALQVPINQSVTPGSKYGIVMRATNTRFSYCIAYSDALPYAAGVARLQPGTGGAWVTDTNRSLRFWTDATAVTPSAVAIGATVVH
jgi:hypothetical protein